MDDIIWKRAAEQWDEVTGVSVDSGNDDNIIEDEDNALRVWVPAWVRVELKEEDLE